LYSLRQPLNPTEGAGAKHTWQTLRGATLIGVSDASLMFTILALHGTTIIDAQWAAQLDPAAVHPR
jgi:hypothetical protein